MSLRCDLIPKLKYRMLYHLRVRVTVIFNMVDLWFMTSQEIALKVWVTD